MPGICVDVELSNAPENNTVMSRKRERSPAGSTALGLQLGFTNDERFDRTDHIFSQTASGATPMEVESLDGSADGFESVLGVPVKAGHVTELVSASRGQIGLEVTHSLVEDIIKGGRFRAVFIDTLQKYNPLLVPAAKPWLSNLAVMSLGVDVDMASLFKKVETLLSSSTSTALPIRSVILDAATVESSMLDEVYSLATKYETSIISVFDVWDDPVTSLMLQCGGTRAQNIIRVVREKDGDIKFAGNA